MCTSIMSLVPNMSQKNPSVLETGPAIAEWMEDNTEVRFKPVPLPDYNISKEGASIGRTMLTKEFDDRRLGNRVKELRYPIQWYSVFGSMQADPEELPALTNPFSSISNFIHDTKRVLRYSSDLLRYGKGTELANGNSLIGRLFYREVAEGVTF